MTDFEQQRRAFTNEMGAVKTGFLDYVNRAHLESIVDEFNKKIDGLASLESLRGINLELFSRVKNNDFQRYILEVEDQFEKT